jgi:hypothetical protein
MKPASLVTYSYIDFDEPVPRAPLSEEERAAIRDAGMEDARRSRIRQGLPERIEDPAAIAILAALLRTPPSTPAQQTADRHSNPAA